MGIKAFLLTRAISWASVMDIVLDVELNPNLHDREIRLDNGWTIKIGRGLDFYQKPDSWFGIGSNDLSLRKCLETKVDVFKTKSDLFSHT